MDKLVIVDHDTAVAVRTLRNRLWREIWLRLGSAHGDRPIAIYGAGRHTIRYLKAMAEVPGGPTIGWVLDDDPRGRAFGDVPVVGPDELSPDRIACVLVSSDTIEDELAERARAWASGTVPVEVIYGGAMDMTLLHGTFAAGTMVRRDEPGVRTVIDDTGTETTERDQPRTNRPAGAIPPTEERKISSYVTPGYRVQTLSLSREVDEAFEPHQLYPGDRHRPGLDMRDECFVTRPEPGLVGKDTRVSVVGSCFASNFKRWLLKHDYNFCQFEDGPFSSQGSLRSGPLFNTGSVCQMVEWAYNGFDAADSHWTVGGRLCDPYRKFLSWPTEADMHAEREAHFAATRNMIEQSEVLILTLGLSEVWRNREDKRCYYLIPPPGILDERYHEHALLTLDECLQHLERFYAVVHERNPALRLVTTLSPVPLMATYFDRHAVLSDAVSKATLRTALHWFCERHPEIVYFPSYEMAVRTPDWPYGPDNRHVSNMAMIDRIMRTFIDQYGTPGEAERLLEPKTDPAARSVA